MENARVDVNGTPIIRDFSFELFPGDKLGIAGRNGAGKSTLLDALVGARKLDGGVREVRALVFVSCNCCCSVLLLPSLVDPRFGCAGGRTEAGQRHHTGEDITPAC